MAGVVDRSRSTWSVIRDNTASRLLSFIREAKDTAQAPRATQQTTHHGAEPTVHWLDPSSVYTSGYVLGVILMAILVNRIQHIVIPPRNAFQQRGHRLNQLNWPEEDDVDPPSFSQRLERAFNSVRRRVLPIDVKSARTRFLILLPSLLHSSRTLVLLFVSILHLVPGIPAAAWTDSRTSSSLMSYAARAHSYLLNAAFGMDIYQTCWMAFKSACMSVVSAALLAGLEGLPGSAPNFSLIGYACVLHSFGAPHLYDEELKGPNGVIRPSPHVLFMIFHPLFQLTLLNTLNTSKRFGTQRLVPTTICSFISLGHFWYSIANDPRRHPYPTFLTCIIETVLITIILITHGLDIFTRLLLSPTPPVAPRPTRQENRSLEQRLGLAPSSWSQALSSMNLLQSTDEFQLALVKVAIACLDATNFVGLANEVAFVRANTLVSENDTEDAEESHSSLHGGLLGEGGFSLFLGLDELETADAEREQRSRRERRRNAGRRNGEEEGSLRARPSVTLSPNDVDITQPLVSSFQRAGSSSPIRSRQHRGSLGRARSVTPFTSRSTTANDGGLSSSREIKRVTTFQSVHEEEDASLSSFNGTERGIIPGLGGYWLEAFSRPELRRLARTVGLFWRGMWIWIWSQASWIWLGITGGRKRESESPAARAGKTGRQGKDRKAGFENEPAYSRAGSVSALIHDDTILSRTFPDEDDEDDDYWPSQPESDHDNDSSDDSDKDTEWMELINTGSFPRFTSEFQYPSTSAPFNPSDVAEDAPSLYSDLRPQETPFLVAHLQSSVDRGPLTRTQYTSGQPLSTFAMTRRLQKASRRQESDPSEEETRRNCVICMSEPRVIICWPCRCLSLCDDCRGSLAARSAGSKHHCPCCRQTVEGYSRIFIP